MEKAAQIKGIYVPRFYNFEYNDDKTIKSVTVSHNAPEKVEKRIIVDIDKVYYPSEFIVPFSDTVHDRAMAEVFRGCIRGCRF